MTSKLSFRFLKKSITRFSLLLFFGLFISSQAISQSSVTITQSGHPGLIGVYNSNSTMNGKPFFVHSQNPQFMIAWHIPTWGTEFIWDIYSESLATNNTQSQYISTLDTPTPPCVGWEFAQSQSPAPVLTGDCTSPPNDPITISGAGFNCTNAQEGFLDGLFLFVGTTNGKNRYESQSDFFTGNQGNAEMSCAAVIYFDGSAWRVDACTTAGPARYINHNIPAGPFPPCNGWEVVNTVCSSNMSMTGGCVEFIPCTDPDVPTLTASSAIFCEGDQITIDISGNLNNATEWVVYEGSCGGTQIMTTTSNSFMVSPIAATTYYVRGEGGCITPGACGDATITESNNCGVDVCSTIDLLIAMVLDLDLNNGQTNSLVSKLENAKAKFLQGNDNATVNKLQAFINQVTAWSGNQIPTPDADELIALAQEIIDAIEAGSGFCPEENNTQNPNNGVVHTSSTWEMADLTLIPNPAHSEVSLQTAQFDGQATQISIFDNTGRIVFQQEIAEWESNYSIDLNDSQFTNGMYMVRLISNEEMVTKRLVVTK